MTRLGTGALALALALGSAPVFAKDEGELRPLVEKALHEIDAWDTEGATHVLEELMAQHPGAPETAWIRGKVLFEQGRYRDAVAAFDDAKSKSGGTSPALDEDRRLAEAADDETKGAQPHESAHFIVRAKAKKDELLVPWALDGLEAAYAALTKDLGYEPPTKVRVEIYDTAQALAHVSPLTVAEIKGSGTIALCKYNRLMITSPRALLRGYPWMDTLSHEFTHFLVTRKGRNTVPIWLQEGLAKFLETRWRGAPGLAVDEFSLQLLEKAAKAKDLIPFAAMHPSIAKMPTQEKAALAFAEVESAIRLLYLRGGQAALTELVAAMASGFSDQQAVTQAYGKPFAQFEADWRVEVAKPRSKKGKEAAAPLATRKLVFKDDAKGKDTALIPEPKDGAARRWARLGELFFARQRWQAAALEYGKARKLLPEEDPVLARRYAYSLLSLPRAGTNERDARDVREARDAMVKAVERDPEDEAGQLLLGQAQFLMGEAAAAKVAYLAAIAIDPFDPALQQSLLALGRATKDATLTERGLHGMGILSGRELKLSDSSEKADAGTAGDLEGKP